MPALLPRTERAAVGLLLEPGGRPGAENMAIDQVLLEEADCTGAAVLRLYRFDPPCLSFGRHEAALARYDRAAIARLGLDIVRRPTGGRAVWHEHEVTYALAAPAATCGSLRDSCLAIHRTIAAALRALGAPVELAATGGPGGPGAGACFAHPAAGEVVVGTRKLVGSAQLRRGGAFLQHGSILLDGSQEMVRRVSRAPQPDGRETTLRAVLGRPVSFAEVAEAIVQAWDATETALDRPRPPSTAAFLDPAWTWRR